MAYCILKSYKLKFEPYRVFEVFSRYAHCFFLDSNMCVQTKQQASFAAGRYSFLGIEPFLKLETTGCAPFEKIRSLLKQYKISYQPSNPPFLGGAVGYLSYESGFALEEKLKNKRKLDTLIPDCFFGFYNSAVIIDHWKGLIYLCATGIPEKNYRLSKALAESNFQKLYRLISRAAEETPENFSHARLAGCGALKSNFDKEAYIAAVKIAKEYIRCGDIYQVNLSQRFESRTTLPGREIYRRLRQTSPADYSAYFRADDCEILSSSPERFLSVAQDKVVTQPMKGTRPRGDNKKSDAILKKELLKSAKDRAELMMIVDLERNDLGKVCRHDSIRVRSLRALETYNTVYQTTATIEGKLRKNKDRLDLLQACFPGGSITGCPKIRAMEIINELETVPRSIYTGALGYLSFSGNMDFNILIRTILKKSDRIYFGVGGGIVADSDPEKEYEETLIKAKGIMEALK